jgi:chemotaxis protein methyltransferase CheR
VGTFGEYYRRVVDDEQELVQMLDRITTNETRFFREPHHFTFIEHRLCPAWIDLAAAGKRPRCVRVWSAGCSTGEEPYSLAMVLRASLPEHEGWTIDVKATDISTRALEVAAGATWPVARADEIPARFLKRFMLVGIGGQKGNIRAGAELRRLVRVERLNLHDQAYPPDGAFDLVLCRNVLIYFEHDQKRRVVQQLLGRIAPGGHLLVGHAESIHGVSGLRCPWPTIYAREDAA